MSQNQIARQRLCLAADKTELVDASDERAAFLFATPGTEILPEVAEQFGLIDGALPGFDEAADAAAATEKEAAEKAAAEAAEKAAADAAWAIEEQKRAQQAAADAAAKKEAALKAAAEEAAKAQTETKPASPDETKPAKPGKVKA